MPRKVPSHWMAGFLEWQWEYGDLPKLEPFIGTVHETSSADFRTWFRRWKPDGLITIIGDEAPRLRAMGIKLRGVDADANDRKALQVVCVNRPHNSLFPGVDANNERVGRKAAETVINQLIHNQYGPPEHPNEILVTGHWIE